MHTLRNLVLLSAVASASSGAAQAAPRERLAFNAGWRFQKGDGPAQARRPEQQVQRWRWKSGSDLAALTEDTSGSEWKDAAAADDIFGGRKAFAWFRATLPTPPSGAKAPFFLRFAGVDDNATVYLNGQKIGGHEGWGEEFEVPVGAAWKAGGPNELAVLIENTEGAGGIGVVALHNGAPQSFTQAAAGFSDAKWRTLDLPHDWGIEGPFDIDLPGETGKLPWAGVGWYRKSFDVPASDKGRRVTLEVDGAMSYAQVWVNGQRVGEWPYGYSSWAMDLTPFLRVGRRNVLAIRLDNKPNSSRWYPGGGIYRNVWLSKTAPVHVAHWGTQVTTQTEKNGRARVTARATLQNEGKAAQQVLVTSTILDSSARPVAKSTARVSLAAGSTQTIESALDVKAARLWSLRNPYRYTLVTQLSRGSQVLDRYTTPFGVRTVQWDATRGFVLNGERVRLNGVCLHHDLGALGAAWNTRAAERQLQIMQSMGVNALRTSHNPPAPEMLDLCDRMGIVVLDEFSDTWKTAKTPNGYARLFDAWAEKDLSAMLMRDRNHPSVIAWSTGNEIAEQWRPGGQEISRFLTGIVHRYDTTRPVGTGNNSTEAGYNGFQKTTDIFGYNYKPGEYGKFRAANPGIPIFGSETSSAISSRGEYFFPLDKQTADVQVSSYDVRAVPWGSTPDREFEGQDRFPFVAGEFVWTGFDYLGEPTPYNSDSTNLLNYSDPAERARAEAELKALGRIKVPSRSSYFGIVDLAGFPKDRFYQYQARWRPDLATAHILPHWNWPERVGEVTPVHVYTSGDEAELFLNGKSQGRKKKGEYEYRLRWDDVVYEPGELKVVAYKGGQEWAQETVRTTGAAAKISLEADRSRIASDGRDLSFVTVRVADAQGRTVPRSKNALAFTISGPGELVATDNGDATDLTSFSSKARKAYNGMALAIVRAKKGQSGQVTLRATSPGLAPSEVVLAARK